MRFSTPGRASPTTFIWHLPNEPTVCYYSRTDLGSPRATLDRTVDQFLPAKGQGVMW